MKKARILGVILIVWQIIDILIHIRAGRVESLRVTSNAIMILGVIICLFVKMHNKKSVYYSYLYAYLGLNLGWFVPFVVEDVSKKGAPFPTIFFVLIIVSTLLYIPFCKAIRKSISTSEN